MSIDPNFLKKLAESIFTFVSINSTKAGINETVKRLAEKTLDEKEEKLITREDIINLQKATINAINAICFVFCMGLYGYAGYTLFTEDDLQKRAVRSGTASMLIMSIAIVAPKKIISK